MEQLKTVMHDLDPYSPDINNLQVIGTSTNNDRYTRAATDTGKQTDQYPTPGMTNDADMEEIDDPLADHPDVYQAPTFGPCMSFAGQILKWTGDSHSNTNWKAADARVGFEAYTGCRTTSVLEMANLGTAAIYYSWKVSEVKMIIHQCMLDREQKCFWQNIPIGLNVIVAVALKMTDIFLYFRNCHNQIPLIWSILVLKDFTSTQATASSFLVIG